MQWPSLVQRRTLGNESRGRWWIQVGRIHGGCCQNKETALNTSDAAQKGVGCEDIPFLLLCKFRKHLFHHTAFFPWALIMGQVLFSNHIQSGSSEFCCQRCLYNYARKWMWIHLFSKPDHHYSLRAFSISANCYYALKLLYVLDCDRSHLNGLCLRLFAAILSS